VYLRDDGVLKASVERAARDLRRIGQNTDLIDEAVLADALSEERVHATHGQRLRGWRRPQAIPFAGDAGPSGVRPPAPVGVLPESSFAFTERARAFP
jgi:hypothetical protein